MCAQRAKSAAGSSVAPSPARARRGVTARSGHLLGYARVSTTEQDPQLQLDALEAAGCYKIRVESVSGMSKDRPELDKTLADLRPGDTLVVWRLDRLGRSLRHLIDLVTELEARGVGLRSLQEAIDTGTSGGKLVFHVFGALAEFERGLIRERTLAGLESARKRGNVGGRRTVMTPAKLKQLRAMVKAGDRPTEIAKALGVGRATVYRHLDTSAAAKSQSAK